MTFDEYQKKSLTTDVFESKMTSVTDPAFVAKLLGMVSEAGEVASKFKKIIRDQGGIINEDNKVQITEELGDVLWYIGVIAHYMGVPFETVAVRNLEKLSSRKARNVITGSGDKR